jgi:hypothetical protein
MKVWHALSIPVLVFLAHRSSEPPTRKKDPASLVCSRCSLFRCRVSTPRTISTWPAGSSYSRWPSLLSPAERCLRHSMLCCRVQSGPRRPVYRSLLSVLSLPVPSLPMQMKSVSAVNQVNKLWSELLMHTIGRYYRGERKQNERKASTTTLARLLRSRNQPLRCSVIFFALMKIKRM